MGRRARPQRVALALWLAVAGCASSLPRSVSGPPAPGDGWEVVEDVPEVRQSSPNGCGAAALAMVLGRWGRALGPDEVSALGAPPAGRGTRADALRDAARRHGLQAFLFEGRAADLEREVARDRPVLVGTVKRRGRRASPHYEVVVGVNPRRGRILTLDPARGLRETSVRKFTKEWAAAGRLTLVVFPARSAARGAGEEQGAAPAGASSAPE